MFYVQLLQPKVPKVQKDSQVISVLHFWDLLPKKAALKTLMKLTLGVNFINILRTNFSYKCCFGSFFYINVTRGKLPKQRLYKKFMSKMLMKLTLGATICNFLTINEKQC